MCWMAKRCVDPGHLLHLLLLTFETLNMWVVTIFSILAALLKKMIKTPVVVHLHADDQGKCSPPKLYLIVETLLNTEFCKSKLFCTSSLMSNRSFISFVEKVLYFPLEDKNSMQLYFYALIHRHKRRIRRLTSFTQHSKTIYMIERHRNAAILVLQ